VRPDIAIQRAKLGVRLGPDSPVYVAYEKLQHHVFALEEVFLSAPPELTVAAMKTSVRLDEPLPPKAEACVDAMAVADASLKQFLAAAAVLVNDP
jgi:hypothetical protein